MRRRLLFFTIAILIYVLHASVWAADVPNRVLSLDGDGDYVEMADSEVLNDIGLRVTMEAWIRLTGSPERWPSIISKQDERTDSWSNRSYRLQLSDGASIYLASAPSGQGQIASSSLDGSITLDIWYHVAGLIDARNSIMRIFINGAEVAHRDFGKDIHVSTLPLQIGHNFEGQMDEVRIWNIARTQEEIQATMFTRLSGKEPGLVGYWRFDGVGDTVTDSSPNSISGKLVGDAYFVEAAIPGPDEFTILSGVITDESGQPVAGASIRLEQDEEEVARAQSDDSGSYHIVVANLAGGLYDLSATHGERAGWQSGIPLSGGERRTVNLMLREAISIQGKLLMLDDRTPHVAVPVEAIRDGEVIDGVLSNENGEYRFINLKPGFYQVRCQVLGGYVYYGEEKAREPESQKVGRSEKAIYSSTRKAISLQVERGKTLKDMDLRFAPFKKGTWRTYTFLDGLAGNYVTSIYGDPDGVMWFGTGGGLSRYDGQEFRNFTTKDGLIADWINELYGDSEGTIWLGTEDGLSRYDGRSAGNATHFVNFTTEDGLVNNYVNAIHGAPDGSIWIGTGLYGTPGGGASRYDGEGFVNFTTQDGLSRDLIHDVHVDSKGVVWFITWGGGVLRYDGKEFRNLTTGDGLASNNGFVVHSAPNGEIWAGTYRSGLSWYNGKEFVTFTTKDGLADNSIRSIHSDPDGVLWFGTEGGLSRYDGKTFVNFTQEDGLASNLITAIHRAPDGVLWVGTRGGVCRYDEGGLQNLTTRDGLAHDSVSLIYGDPDGALWFATHNSGVTRYDGKEFINLTTRDGLVDNRVNAIHRDPDGVLWFGAFAWPAGVSRYYEKEFVTLEKGNVMSIQRAPDGTLWFGGSGGVYRYNGEWLADLDLEDGLPNRWVGTIYRAPDNAMWVGTSGGAARYDGQKFIPFTTKDGLPDNYINCIYGASDGMLWFGTDAGVSQYDGEEFVTFSAEDGLAGHSVYSIHRDTRGIIWFGTDTGGVSLYDGSVWNSIDMRDGLAGNMVWSIYEETDGSLLFATEGGITIYRRSNTPPSVRVVSMKTDKEYNDLQAIPPITTGGRVTIRYGSIDFVTIPEKRLYRYRIKELDSDWRRPTRETSFEHTFREPGTYTFEVQAIDRDLNYSEPASIELVVISPFYLRAIFLIPTIGSGTILLAALVGLTTALVKRRRQVHAYQQSAVQELQDAHEMQLSLLPESSPLVEGMEVAGRSITANTVGGDFFDYISLPDGKIGIAMADVSGKGLRAAMNATMTNGMMHEVATIEASCGSILSRLNAHMYPLMEKQMFTAFSLAILDSNAGVIQWANAAQPLPLIKRSDGASEAEGDGELPLGMMPDVEYPDYELKLQSGDTFIFYTDGIIEAENEAEEMYGTERLLNLVSGIDLSASAENVIETILQDVADFVGVAEQYDDMTIVVAKKLENSNAA